MNDRNKLCFSTSIAFFTNNLIFHFHHESKDISQNNSHDFKIGINNNFGRTTGKRNMERRHRGGPMILELSQSY